MFGALSKPEEKKLSLFGATPITTGSEDKKQSLFGAPSATDDKKPSASLFGASIPKPSGSLFGPASTSTGSLFGSAAPATSVFSVPSLFAAKPKEDEDEDSDDEEP